MLGFPPGKRLEEVVTADQYISPFDHSYWRRVHWMKRVIIKLTSAWCPTWGEFFFQVYMDIYIVEVIYQ